MKKKILCTLGPSSLNKKVINRLVDLGVDVLRLNMSHIKPYQLADMISLIQSVTDTPICIDTEGAQVRTGDMVDKAINIRENAIVKVYKMKVPGDPFHFNLYPLDIVDQLQVNDFLSIDFNSVYAQVIEKDSSGATLRVINGGMIGQNKAVTIERDVKLNPLTEKDLKCIEIAKEMGIKHYALSFANFEEDVDYIRNLVGDDSFIISKIECKNGIENLNGILNKSDAILIDRGDLSREVPIQKIPFFQKHIINCGKKANREVYVATNLLESMIENPQPTRAEVNDIFNTLNDNADGLVLAAETAIGKYPIAAARMVSELIAEHGSLNDSTDLVELMYKPDLFCSNLVAPHGGELITQVLTKTEIEAIDNSLKRVIVSTETILDCEQIAYGTYSPLKGFIGKDDLESVLDNYSLSNGTIWTMPVVLQSKDEKTYEKGKKVVVTDSEGNDHSLLTIKDVYKMDLSVLTEKWFGTNSTEHPGVKKVYSGGEFFIEAEVELISPTSLIDRQYSLTPLQLRHIFSKKGWQKIVGFHTRNVPHQAHEFIQKYALETSSADGLFIGPVVGPKKKGDFNGKPILEAYQRLIDFGYYPSNRVALSSFATYSRYSGPREAVFTALCRKNMGCSHFIIGRDHTGVGKFYGEDDNKNLFDKLGNIGIEIIYCSKVSYNSDTKKHEFVKDVGTYENISGTLARESIMNKKMLPDWFMREIVQEHIHELIEKQENVFSS